MTVDQFEPDEAWVPADRRWLGLDRRTIAPALVVFALAMLMAVVLPLADSRVANEDAVATGDVIALEGGVTFVPEPGWEIISGVRADDRAPDAGYPSIAILADGDVVFTVRSSEFAGDVHALLDQLKANSAAVEGDDAIKVTGSPEPIATDDGEKGLIANVAGPHASGMIAVFKFDGRGVAVVATGPAELHDFPETAVVNMITSIRHTDGQNS